MSQPSLLRRAESFCFREDAIIRFGVGVRSLESSFGWWKTRTTVCRALSFWNSTNSGKHRGEITHLFCVQNDQKLITVSLDGSVKRFKLAPFPSSPSPDETPAEESIDAILSSVDSFLSIDDLLSFDAATPSMLSPLHGSETPLSSSEHDTLERSFCLNQSVGIADVCFNASHSLLAVSFASPSIFLLSADRIDSDAWSSPPFWVLEGHSAAVTCFAVDSRCHLVSGSTDHQLLRHDFASFACTGSQNLHRAIHAISCVDEWSFIGSSDYAILASSPQFEASLTGHCGQITSLALARSDGILVSGSFDVRAPRESDL